MSNTLFQLEPLVRLGCFLTALVAVGVWEALAPRRPWRIGRVRRWPNNLGLVLINTIVVRLLFPAGGVGMALFVQDRHWGLLNQVALPGWMALPLAIVLLDLAIYAQHRLFHAVPSLWRLHRVHHADTEFDVTTGLRFHPVEIVLSMAIKGVVIAALGAPPASVLVFEVLLNATALFNHGNVRVPDRLETALRWLVVTPDMHRVHHSIRQEETDSNFGFNVPWWDRVFGTYRAQPAVGHAAMVIGVEAFRDQREIWLDRLLSQPFRDGPRAGDGPNEQA